MDGDTHLPGEEADDDLYELPSRGRRHVLADDDEDRGMDGISGVVSHSSSSKPVPDDTAAALALQQEEDEKFAAQLQAEEELNDESQGYVPIPAKKKSSSSSSSAQKPKKPRAKAKPYKGLAALMAEADEEDADYESSRRQRNEFEDDIVVPLNGVVTKKPAMFQSAVYEYVNSRPETEERTKKYKDKASKELAKMKMAKQFAAALGMVIKNESAARKGKSSSSSAAFNRSSFL